MHIKQTVCKVMKIFQYGKYLVAYVLKSYSCWKNVLNDVSSLSLKKIVSIVAL